MGSSHFQFKKSLLASSVAAACIMSPVAAVAEGPTEEVIVSGLRASLQRSLDVKRDATGVVDAISAEDIGKFPDSNLAEALQRITGVSIDRRNGEGFQVTVRGFGPDFNQVTLNGRTMPAAQLDEESNLRSGRAFDMSNIAAEGVSGVAVYKSSQANITSGGIGATVDLQTRKPFDNDGLVLSVGTKALMDTTNRAGDDITPELSLFSSWSDDIFGASLAFSHQERDSGRSGAFFNDWNDSKAWVSPADSIPNGVHSDVNVINEPPVGAQTNTAPGLRYAHSDIERTRQNAQVTFQVRPSDSVELTLDYTSATQEIDVNRAELSFWYRDFATSAIQFEDEGGVYTPIYWLQEAQVFDTDSQQTVARWDPTDPNDNSPRDVGHALQRGALKNTLDSIGFNAEFQATDTLSFNFDYHSSKAVAEPGSGGPEGGSSWYNLGLGSQGVPVQGWDNSGDLPLLVGIYDERNASNYVGAVENQLDIEDVGSAVAEIFRAEVEQTVDQVRIDGKFEFSDSSSIDFGIERREMEVTNKRSTTGPTLLEGGWGVSNPGDIPEGTLEQINFLSLFDGYRTGLTDESAAFFANNYDGPEASRLQVFGEVGFQGNANDIAPVLFANQGASFASNPLNSIDRNISETINSIYAQLNTEGELGDMTYRATAGVRYESTEAESKGRVGQSDIVWSGNDDLNAIARDASTAELQSFTSSYDHLLPNFSVALDVTDDILVRSAWGKSIARQNFDNLEQGLSEVTAPVGGPTVLGGLNGTATNGAISLQPTESDNFDISAEWYFDDSSYVSVGYFDKRVRNFAGIEEIVTSAVESGTRDPSAGPRAEAALAQLIEDGLASNANDANPNDLFRYVAANNAEGCENVQGDFCGNGDPDAIPYESTNTQVGWEDAVDLLPISSGSLQDPYSVLDVETAVNKNDARLNGWELAVQHFFGETGFGVQANYTLVNSNFEYDVASRAQQFALTGLSDTANLVLMYEKNSLQARIAYNWRDEFLSDAGDEPQFTEAYQSVDFSVNYSINDNFSVGLEGFNIFDEDLRIHQRSSSQLTRLEIYGARYALTGRYSF